MMFIIYFRKLQNINLGELLSRDEDDKKNR